MARILTVLLMRIGLSDSIETAMNIKVYLTLVPHFLPIFLFMPFADLTSLGFGLVYIFFCFILVGCQCLQQQPLPS